MTDVVDGTGAQAGDAGGMLHDDQAVYLLDVGQAVVRPFLVEGPVVGVAGVLEGAAQDPVRHLVGPGADALPPVSDAAVFVDHLGGLHQHLVPVQDEVEGTESGLLQLEHHGVVAGRLDRFPWHGCQLTSAWGRVVSGEPAQTQVTLKGVLYIPGSELATVHRCLVMPVNALADVDDNGCVVGLFPALRQRPSQRV